MANVVFSGLRNLAMTKCPDFLMGPRFMSRWAKVWCSSAGPLAPSGLQTHLSI